MLKKEPPRRRNQLNAAPAQNSPGDIIPPSRPRRKTSARGILAYMLLSLFRRFCEKRVTPSIVFFGKSGGNLRQAPRAILKETGPEAKSSPLRLTIFGAVRKLTPKHLTAAGAATEENYI